jgi:hypothetical protein
MLFCCILKTIWALPSGFKKDKKTYNSGYSLVVTHLTTNPPVRCLSTAERTGSSDFNALWSYVLGGDKVLDYIRYIKICASRCGP